MVDKIERYLEQNILVDSSHSILVAVSGGRDSIVLLDVLVKLRYTVEVAHCNFSLRGKESEAETVFVQKHCQNIGVKYHFKKFNTSVLSTETKESIQVTARNIRYEWFYELLNNENLDFVATGHHLDDQLETFLINLSRGTGIKGLSGIPCKNDKIIRPLLSCSRIEISAYAHLNNLKYCDDSSNSDNKYLRNKIRNKIVPLLVETTPSFLSNFETALGNLAMVDDQWSARYKEWCADFISKQGGRITAANVLKVENKSFFSFFLKENNFSTADVRKICSSSGFNTGAEFYGVDKVVMFERGVWQYRTKKTGDIAVDTQEYFIEAKDCPVDVTLENVLKSNIQSYGSNKNEIYINKEVVKGSLIIRKWRQGDAFVPFGMRGKKKLSDFFIDNKFSKLDKENIWLLCDEKSIIWLLGVRMDNRYRIGENTKDILKITVSWCRARLRKNNI